MCTPHCTAHWHFIVQWLCRLWQHDAAHVLVCQHALIASSGGTTVRARATFLPVPNPCCSAPLLYLQ
jgi:hypothetical protein